MVPSTRGSWRFTYFEWSVKFSPLRSSNTLFSSKGMHDAPRDGRWTITVARGYRRFRAPERQQAFVPVRFRGVSCQNRTGTAAGALPVATRGEEQRMSL